MKSLIHWTEYEHKGNAGSDQGSVLFCILFPTVVRQIPTSKPVGQMPKYKDEEAKSSLCGYSFQHIYISGFTDYYNEE